MSTPAEDSTTTIINLNHSDNNAKLEVSQLIQQRSYNTLTARIKLDLERINNLHPIKSAFRGQNDYPYGSGTGLLH